MDERLPWIALGLVGAFAAVQTARLWWAGASRRWRLARRRERAAIGERDAERLLRRAGYRVIDRQAKATLAYALDGAPSDFEVRADLLVRRGGRTFVAEVKTGEEAPRLSTAATRRQLLEYAHAFDVDGVLLVSPEAGAVHEVSLPARPSGAAPRALSTPAALLVGALVGALAAALVAAWWLGRG